MKTITLSAIGVSLAIMVAVPLDSIFLNGYLVSVIVTGIVMTFGILVYLVVFEICSKLNKKPQQQQPKPFTGNPIGIKYGEMILVDVGGGSQEIKTEWDW